MYRRPPTGCQLVEPQSKPGSDPTAPHSLSRCSFLFPPLWPRGARCGHAILGGTVHQGLERAWAPPPHGSPSLYGCLAGLQAGDGHVRAPVCPMRTQMPCRGWVSPRPAHSPQQRLDQSPGPWCPRDPRGSKAGAVRTEPFPAPLPCASHAGFSAGSRKRPGPAQTVTQLAPFPITGKGILPLSTPWAPQEVLAGQALSGHQTPSHLMSQEVTRSRRGPSALVFPHPGLSLELWG